MKLLKKETFCVQFNNRHRAPRPYRRRKTYLCYELQLPGSTTRDYLQNKKGRHAEIRFVEMIRSLELDRDQHCQVTGYLTWSPCPSCAQELAELKRSHPRLRLQLFTSRLYFHWIREFQEGLQLLWRCGVPVRVMGLREFTHCWDKFVDHGETPFELERWEGLERYSKTIQNRLLRILRSWGLEDLVDDLRNLRL